MATLLANTVRALIVVASVMLLAGFIQDEEQRGEKEYPKPRFPSHLKQPQSAEEVKQAVQGLVRNRSTFEGKGMGAVQPGEAAVLVPTSDSEDMIVEGIRLALEERGVKVYVLPNYEAVGVSRKDALALRETRRAYTAEHGYLEAAVWMRWAFADLEAAKQWLKGKRPDLYEKVFPKDRELPEHLKVAAKKLSGASVGLALQEFLKKHPDVKAVFWRRGGATGARRALYPDDAKYGGVFTADNRWEAMSRVGSYPADVWQLSEELTLESLAYVDRMEAKDPEGTDVWADISRVQAENWARGAYQRGHLYMFPNIATGRFGYSVVTYPAFQNEWIPREPIARVNGVLAGTGGHGGFFPRWEVQFKDGFISEVRSGGLYGEMLREFLKYPKVNEVTYPYHETPGFWYLYEIAFGTNPKYFRNPKALMEGGFSLGPERMAAGVVHWGLGIRISHDPDSRSEAKKWKEFSTQHNLPGDHGFHTHTYFTTYRVHLGGADRWLTLLDRGHITSLDSPEVRALASRYGDPDEVLAKEWIPEVPGINAPGRYEDYAANPWKYAKSVNDKVMAGTYEHFYPAAKIGGNGR